MICAAFAILVRYVRQAEAVEKVNDTCFNYLPVLTDLRYSGLIIRSVKAISK